jgi:nuclear-control-of-ATPase protein 2
MENAKSSLQCFVDGIVGALFYKPPIGVVTLGTFYHWIKRYRRRQQLTQNGEDTADDRRLTFRRRHCGRAFTLDLDDQSYVLFGGIERVRSQLLVAAFQRMRHIVKGTSNRDSMPLPYKDPTVWSLEEASQSTDDDNDYETSKLKIEPSPTFDDIARDVASALEVYHSPRTDRDQFIKAAIVPMLRLQNTWLSLQESVEANVSVGRDILVSNSDEIGEQFMLVESACLTAQVRLVDALIRVGRDRTLEKCSQLARQRDYWEHRVKGTQQSQLQQWASHWLGNGTAFARYRYTSSKAAYKTEIRRLEKFVAILLERNPECNESSILNAVRDSVDAGSACVTLKFSWNDLASCLLSYESWSRGLQRINDYVKSFAHHVQSWRLDGAKAAQLLSADSTYDALAMQSWLKKARSTLCECIREALEDSTYTNGACSSIRFQELEKQWWPEKEELQISDAPQWHEILSYVDNIGSWKRVGEGGVRGFGGMALIDNMWQLNRYQLPSSLARISFAHFLHRRWKPYWPLVRDEATKGFHKAVEIGKQRVWIPFKGIYDDIMNKSPGIFSAFGLEMEEKSLDHMLRDIGFGDGNPKGRQAALQAATEEYEGAFQSSLLANVVQGRFARLMLVQMQQLKVGMLSALDTIDVLLQGNRIHFQILAAIPALIMATYGTRLVARFLHNLRARDLRPVTAVHAEMVHHLRYVQELLLRELAANGAESAGNSDGTIVLAEVLVSVHRYLTLLDFGSPPFSAAECDAIHGRLVALVQQVQEQRKDRNGISTEHTLAWLRMIQNQHDRLLR